VRIPFSLVVVGYLTIYRPVSERYNTSATEGRVRVRRYLLILTLLSLSFPGFSYAQSLGDIAREVRAEKQKSESPQPKVITNEDLKQSAPAQEIGSPVKAPVQDVATEGSQAAKASAVAVERSPEVSAKERAEELETQKRTAEINKNYLGRIAALRDQINTAQLELAKLQGEYINRWTIPERYPEPDVPFREQQALAFNQQISELIEAQSKRIDGLKSQLRDLQEEARHAGVPHATD